jgi:hypothetical protein
MDLLVLCVRRGVLTELKDTGPEEEDGKEQSTMELADVYKGKDEEEGVDGGIERVDNPMHSVAMSQLREKNAELCEDNAELRGENTRLKERLRQHGTIEDGDDIEAKEKTTTMSVPKQQTVEFAIVYKSKDVEEGMDDTIRPTANPLHTTAIEENAALTERIEALEAENRQLRESLDAQP